VETAFEELAPLAIVQGMPLTELPQDLYIPPEALRVFLETFEGPLDLLLYLIQKQNLDILNIPITEITRQYLSYIGLMRELQLDLAAEYLVMAALLLEIKSRMLLPRPEEEAQGEEEGDPRSRLVQQLQEYARFKQAAQSLAELPQLGRDTFLVEAEMPEITRPRLPPAIRLDELLHAMRDVLVRMELFAAHQISREPLSVRERMSAVLSLLQEHPRALFEVLYTSAENRAGVVVALLAILELAKESLLLISQEEAFGPIHIQPVASGHAPPVIGSDWE
jgi:segregation and condensation protein A